MGFSKPSKRDANEGGDDEDDVAERVVDRRILCDVSRFDNEEDEKARGLVVALLAE